MDVSRVRDQLEDLLCADLEGQTPESVPLDRLLPTYAAGEWVRKVCSEVRLEESVEGFYKAQERGVRMALEDLGSRSPIRSRKWVPAIRRMARWYQDAHREVFGRRIRVLSPVVPLQRQKRVPDLIRLDVLLSLLDLSSPVRVGHYLRTVMRFKRVRVFSLRMMASPLSVLDYVRSYRELWSLSHGGRVPVHDPDYYDGLISEVVGIVQAEMTHCGSLLELELILMLTGLEATNLYALSSPLIQSLVEVGLIGANYPDLEKSLEDLSQEARRDPRVRGAVDRVRRLADDLTQSLPCFGPRDLEVLEVAFPQSSTAALSWYGGAKSWR